MSKFLASLITRFCFLVVILNVHLVFLPIVYLLCLYINMITTICSISCWYRTSTVYKHFVLRTHVSSLNALASEVVQVRFCVFLSTLRLPYCKQQLVALKVLSVSSRTCPVSERVRIAKDCNLQCENTRLVHLLEYSAMVLSLLLFVWTSLQIFIRHFCRG